ncbi:MAG TPA: imidazoleglycerol-phosphate dehydratase HisB [Symbiobacteriaceae bacterium]|nr:imidazoleglycerol-phosphate dehydratase HisB [Symbiobacteriaceae bacterium]
MTRAAAIERNTKETKIKVQIDLDGSGKAEIRTGIPFFDHMLEQVARHGLFDLKVEADGDLQIDPHHTVEDTGITLGQAIKQALGDARGIRRWGAAWVPFDETLAFVTMDVSGRPFLACNATFTRASVGAFDTELVPEFFRAVAVNAGLTLHMKIEYGANNHHMIEALFKGFGRALDEATRLDERRTDIPSTKGVLL